MHTHLELGDVTVDVFQKDIKNIHLSVHPPTGRIRIAAPSRLSLDAIRVFAISKLKWIKQQQVKLQKQERETPREYIERESHYLWGKRYLLKIIERSQPPSIELEHNRIVLNVRPHTNAEARCNIFEEWYREQIKREIPHLLAKWEPILGVKSAKCFIRRMKTKWGSCNITSRNILLNTDLAKKPPQCLEYILVHEMVHLLEPTHNPRFVAFMDSFIPKWRSCRQLLNQLPVRHEHWEY
jgi:predicted metal-dependent hydrolase